MTSTQEKLTSLRESLAKLVREHELFRGRKDDLLYEIVKVEQEILDETGLISEDFQKKLMTDLEKISSLVPTNYTGGSIELKHAETGNWKWIVEVSSSFHSSLRGWNSEGKTEIHYDFIIKTTHPHVESIVTKYMNDKYCSPKEKEYNVGFDREYKGCSCCTDSLHINIPKTRWGTTGY